MGKRNIMFGASFITLTIIAAIYMFIEYKPGQSPAIDEYFDHVSEGATDCVDCHEKITPGHHFNGQCSYCHDEAAWKPAFFDHTFPMDHEGANGDCSSCHSVEDYQDYTCYGCHDHTAESIAAKHTEEGIPDYSNCMACHTYEQEPDS